MAASPRSADGVRCWATRRPRLSEKVVPAAERLCVRACVRASSWTVRLSPTFGEDTSAST